MTKFGRLCFQKFAARGSVEKQILSRHDRAAIERSRLHRRHCTADRLHPAGVLRMLLAGGDDQSRDRGETGQGFTAKAEARDAFEIVKRGDFTGGVARQRQWQINGRHANAVVGNGQVLDAALKQRNVDAHRARIKRVFQQLFQRRCRSLNHLACGDLVDQQFREYPDGGMVGQDDRLGSGGKGSHEFDHHSTVTDHREGGQENHCGSHFVRRVRLVIG